MVKLLQGEDEELQMILPKEPMQLNTIMEQDKLEEKISDSDEGIKISMISSEKDSKAMNSNADSTRLAPTAILALTGCQTSDVFDGDSVDDGLLVGGGEKKPLNNTDSGTTKLICRAVGVCE